MDKKTWEWQSLAPNDITIMRKQRSSSSTSSFQKLYSCMAGWRAADLVTPAGQKLEKQEEPLSWTNPAPDPPQKKSSQEAQRKSRLPRANRVREWGCDVIIRKLCPTAQLKATPKNNNNKKKRFSLRWLNLTVDQKLNVNKKHEKTKIKNMERLWRHWKLQNSNKNRRKKKKKKG